MWTERLAEPDEAPGKSPNKSAQSPDAVRFGSPSLFCHWTPLACVAHAPGRAAQAKADAKAKREQQLLELITVHLADWLQQVVQVNMTEHEEKRMSHDRNGVAGFSVIPPGAWFSWRQEPFRQMSEIVGGEGRLGHFGQATTRQQVAEEGAPAAELGVGRLAAAHARRSRDGP